MILRHGQGLAARPQVRDNLKVARSWYSPFPLPRLHVSFPSDSRSRRSLPLGPLPPPGFRHLRTAVPTFTRSSIRLKSGAAEMRDRHTLKLLCSRITMSKAADQGGRVIEIWQRKGRWLDRNL
jgi:hypothetical protein